VREVAEEVAARSVTLLGNRSGIVPVDPAALQKRLLYIGPRDLLSVQWRAAALHYWPHDSVARVTFQSNLRHDLQQARVVVVVAENREHLDDAAAIRRKYPKKAMVLIWFGNPYLLRGTKAEAWICTYSAHVASRRAAMDVVVGRRAAPGASPVTVVGQAARNSAQN
jgi:hypothetical protein